jgi:hypothetical protein
MKPSAVNLESNWGQLSWSRLEVDLGSTWSQLEVNLGSPLGQLGVNLGSTWGQLGSTCGQLGVNLGSTCLTLRLFCRLSKASTCCCSPSHRCSSPLLYGRKLKSKSNVQNSLSCRMFRSRSQTLSTRLSTELVWRFGLPTCIGGMRDRWTVP